MLTSSQAYGSVVSTGAFELSSVYIDIEQSTFVRNRASANCIAPCVLSSLTSGKNGYVTEAVSA